MTNSNVPSHHSNPVTKYTPAQLLNGAPQAAVSESLAQRYAYRLWFRKQR